MKNILDFLIDTARITYMSVEGVLLKTLALALSYAVVGSIIFFVLIRFVFRPGSPGSPHRDISLGVIFLWTITALLLIYNLYWVFIIWVNGTASFAFADAAFWAALSPDLFVYFALIGLFYYRYRSVQLVTK